MEHNNRIYVRKSDIYSVVTQVPDNTNPWSPRTERTTDFSETAKVIIVNASKKYVEKFDEELAQQKDLRFPGKKCQYSCKNPAICPEEAEAVKNNEWNGMRRFWLTFGVGYMLLTVD